MALTDIIDEQEKSQPVAAPKASLPTPDRFLMGAAKSIAFGKVGDDRLKGVWFEGTIVDQETTQQTHYDTGQLLYWSVPLKKPVTDDDGGLNRPMAQLVITLQTDLEEDEDDDGLRRLFIAKSEQTKALKEALKAAGVRTLQDGGHLRFRWVGERPPKDPKHNNARTYEAEYTPPTQDEDES